jgi:hypothetical protein
MKMQVIVDAKGEVLVALRVPDAIGPGESLVGVAPAQEDHTLHEIEVAEEVMSLVVGERLARIKDHMRK